MVDFRWMSYGGLLLDGSGDIAVTSAYSAESLVDMVHTRLKAALDGWKLYRIGAGLQERIGDTIEPDPAELDLKIKRQVSYAMTVDFLPRGAFEVETLFDGSRVHVMVYLFKQLVATAVMDRQEGSVDVR